MTNVIVSATGSQSDTLVMFEPPSTIPVPSGVYAIKSPTGDQRGNTPRTPRSITAPVATVTTLSVPLR